MWRGAQSRSGGGGGGGSSSGAGVLLKKLTGLTKVVEALSERLEESERERAKQDEAVRYLWEEVSLLRRDAKTRRNADRHTAAKAIQVPTLPPCHAVPARVHGRLILCLCLLRFFLHRQGGGAPMPATPPLMPAPSWQRNVPPNMQPPLAYSAWHEAALLDQRSSSASHDLQLWQCCRYVWGREAALWQQIVDRVPLFTDERSHSAGKMASCTNAENAAATCTD